MWLFIIYYEIGARVEFPQLTYLSSVVVSKLLDFLIFHILYTAGCLGRTEEACASENPFGDHIVFFYMQGMKIDE